MQNTKDEKPKSGKGQWRYFQTLEVSGRERGERKGERRVVELFGNKFMDNPHEEKAIVSLKSEKMEEDEKREREKKRES